jgi:hypothetical protein
MSTYQIILGFKGGISVFRTTDFLTNDFRTSDFRTKVTFGREFPVVLSLSVFLHFTLCADQGDQIGRIFAY